MTDVLTPAKSLTEQTVGGNSNTWGTILNSTLLLVDKALAGRLSKALSGDVTLSATEAQNIGYTFTGALSAAAAVTWPTYYGLIYVENSTTGGYTITCGMASGATVKVRAGENAFIWSDGTLFTAVANQRYATAPPLTIYVRKAGGSGSDDNSGLTSGAPVLTLAKACRIAAGYHARGGNIIIDIGTGDWAEDVFINGPLLGSLCFDAIPNIGTTWPAMIVLSGNGRGNTTISGSGNTLATVCSSNNAIVGVKNLKLTANRTAGQCCLFAQLGGGINVFAGVEFGTSNAGDHAHAENTAYGIQFWENWYITGGGATHMNAGDDAQILVSAGTGAISGTPAFTTAFIVASHGLVQFNSGNPFTGSATGKRFNILSNAGINTDGTFSASALPGDNPGVIRSGAKFNGALTPTIAATTGLGSGSGASIASGSGVYSGQVQLTAGAGASASGTVTLNFPASLLNSNLLTCFGVASPSAAGTGAWILGTTITMGNTTGGPPAVIIYWANGGGSGLTNGQLYAINYCFNPD